MYVVLGKVLVCLRLRIMLLCDVLGEVFVGEMEGKMFDLLVMFFLIILVDLSKSSHCHNQDTEYNLEKGSLRHVNKTPKKRLNAISFWSTNTICTFTFLVITSITCFILLSFIHFA